MNCDPDYFSLNVKKNIKDIYDRKEEIRIIKESEYPILVLTGIRRLGKSTLISVGIDKEKGIIVDLRGTGPNPSPLLLLKRFEEAINSTGIREFWGYLSSKISSITLGPVGISFRKNKMVSTTFSYLFDSIQDYAEKNNIKFTIALDEVQEARGYKPLIESIAHSYDYNKNIRFILAGSQIGLLKDFLGTEDPESPLYGRYIYELNLRRFNYNESIDFLNKGFEACKSKPVGVEEAVEKLDGIVGWLVYYGYRAINENGDINSIVEKAIKLEMLEILKLKGKYYKVILKAVSMGANTWSNIFRYVKGNLDVVSNSSFNDALNRLVKYSFLEKKNDEYEIPDPIIKEAAMKINI